MAINSPPSYYNVFAAFDVLKLFTLQIRQFFLTTTNASIDVYLCVSMGLCVCMRVFINMYMRVF